MAELTDVNEEGFESPVFLTCGCVWRLVHSGVDFFRWNFL